MAERENDNCELQATLSVIEHAGGTFTNSKAFHCQPPTNHASLKGKNGGTQK
jgi:hypothetical protein